MITWRPVYDLLEEAAVVKKKQAHSYGQAFISYTVVLFKRLKGSWLGI